MTELSRPAKAAFHQRPADALVLARRVNGQRPEQQRGSAADGDRPKSDRADDHILVGRDKGQLRQPGAALAQAVGGLSEAPWPKGAIVESFDEVVLIVRLGRHLENWLEH